LVALFTLTTEREFIMATSVAHRSIVVVHRPQRISGFLTLVKAISQSMAAAPSTFPTPNPSLAQFNSDIAAFDAAETTAKTRTPGAAQTRDLKRALVLVDLDHEIAYVQSVVDANPTNAGTIAAAAGMSLRKVASRTKAPLAVKASTTSGSVKLVAKAVAKHTSNEWQYSVDGGKTWVSAPPTTQSKTTIPNLSPGVLTQFRSRAILKTGPSNWSDPVTLMVV